MSHELELLKVEHLDAIRRHLYTIAFWIGLAVALSIVGGVLYGVAYVKEQERLEKILEGGSGDGACSDSIYSDLPSC